MKTRREFIATLAALPLIGRLVPASYATPATGQVALRVIGQKEIGGEVWDVLGPEVPGAFSEAWIEGGNMGVRRKMTWDAVPGADSYRIYFKQ